MAQPVAATVVAPYSNDFSVEVDEFIEGEFAGFSPWTLDSGLGLYSWSFPGGNHVGAAVDVSNITLTTDFTVTIEFDVDPVSTNLFSVTAFGLAQGFDSVGTPIGGVGMQQRSDRLCRVLPASGSCHQTTGLSTQNRNFQSIDTYRLELDYDWISSGLTRVEGSLARLDAAGVPIVTDALSGTFNPAGISAGSLFGMSVRSTFGGTAIVHFDSFTVSVPEPSSPLLLLAALLGSASWRGAARGSRSSKP